MGSPVAGGLACVPAPCGGRAGGGGAGETIGAGRATCDGTLAGPCPPDTLGIATVPCGAMPTCAAAAAPDVEKGCCPAIPSVATLAMSTATIARQGRSPAPTGSKDTAIGN